MTKPDLMAELAEDLRTMAGGELPDGDGVTMPVVLWAERWLPKITAHHAELEAAVRDAIPTHEQRAGGVMKLRTKLRPVGSRMSTDGEPADAWHDAKAAHALVLELRALHRVAKGRRTHEGELVVNLIETAFEQASRQMTAWGFVERARS